MPFMRKNQLVITTMLLACLIFVGVTWPASANADNTGPSGSNSSAAPESTCNKVPDPAGCKKAYEQCGSGNSSSVIKCKNKVIGDNLAKTLPQINPKKTVQQNIQSANKYSSPGCSTGTCGHQCGGGSNSYTPSIDLGCRGQGNPIMDALFGIIRFLSDGVGLVVIGSIIVGGIQYTASRGDPQATALAINRIRSSLIALIIYIFAYALLNYIIPAGVLK